MTEVDRIVNQLERASQGGAWHGPALLELLADVTASQAAARPLPRAHTIWEIVLHLDAWHRAIRRRLDGEVVQLVGEEDWPVMRATGEAAWWDSIEALRASSRELRGAIAQLADAELERRAPGKTYSLYVMLHGVIQHDLYHAGQIALLKKQEQ